MIKRLALIGFFTGTGHLFSILLLKEIAGKMNPFLFSQIGKADSLLLFLINIIAFGLQSSAMRNIATSKDWQNEYKRIQSARLSLAIIMMAGTVAGLWDKANYIYLITPLLALSGDYALYATGKPVAGAAIALVRVVLPYFFTLIATAFFPFIAFEVFLLSVALTFLLTNYIIANILRSAVFVSPSIKNLHLYLQNLPLGIVTLSLYFLGLGITLIVVKLYDASTSNVVFLGLKVYMIFKGVLRIIHQAFIREMTSVAFCRLVDKISTQFGLVFFFLPLFFPDTFISLFIGKEFTSEKYFFILLGLSGFVYSLFASVTTKALLDKIDKTYAKISLLSAFISMISITVFSFIEPLKNSSFVAAGLLSGEILFSYLMLKALNKYNTLQMRISEVSPAIMILLVFSGVRLFAGDSKTAFAASTVLFALVFVWHNYQQLNRSIKLKA